MADKTTGADQAASTPGMPQLDFSTFPNQIFWLVVTLVVIYLILNRVALPRIASVLADRSGSIQRDLDQAEDMKRQAVEAEEAYLDKAIEKADAEIAARAAEGEKAITEIRKNAQKSVTEVANATAKDIVGAMMPGSADAKTIKAAVTARLKG